MSRVLRHSGPQLQPYQSYLSVFFCNIKVLDKILQLLPQFKTLNSTKMKCKFKRHNITNPNFKNLEYVT